MSHSFHVKTQMLGQSGCRLDFNNIILYVDPYLSNSAEELVDSNLKRKIPVPIQPETIIDADWVIISHDHIDHCDAYTIKKITDASPQAKIIGTVPVIKKLVQYGINNEKILLALEDWFNLGDDLKICAIPAAHPNIQRDENGNLECIGYLIDYCRRKIYIAGDTSAHREIVDILLSKGPIHTAILPVNEHNYYRNRQGIIGNMSVREAFAFASEIGVKQVIPVHWDMFTVNDVDIDEIRLIYKHLNPGFSLLINPVRINLCDVHISIIIRTLNEAANLDSLLNNIKSQNINDLKSEVVLVDSGSTDSTVAIAERHGCHIRHITREEFSFGRSLNIGCNASNGDILVITSGHCLPFDDKWLYNLCQPIINGNSQYTYGRQLGNSGSYYSECQIFSKYFPNEINNHNAEFYCNNANSAISRIAWEKYRFNEILTGLEDMELAQRLVREGGKVSYVPDATVYHLHNETMRQVKHRFERESIALQSIMPQIHIRYHDMLRYIITSIFKDCLRAYNEGLFGKKFKEIIQYRWNQYRGSYKGNNEHRKLSHLEKEKYFYPDFIDHQNYNINENYRSKKNCRIVANES
jgi:L-ascorbate metabolism protein UlaG (beta-lactamase superfamily)/glycosyltransferase involved in cell wall biosynthesis